MYKILMIEDDRFRLHEYSAEMNDNGFQVTAVSKVSEFIKYLQEDSFDAFVMDVNIYSDEEIPFSNIETMGGWYTGVTLAKYARNFHPDTYIAALTLSMHPDVVSFFTRNNTVGYYNKNFFTPKVFAYSLLFRMNQSSSIIMGNIDPELNNDFDRSLLIEELNDYKKYFEFKYFRNKEVVVKKIDDIMMETKSGKKENILNSIFNSIQLFSSLITIYSIRDMALRFIKKLVDYIVFISNL